jgi:hypothetical protein
MLSRAASSSAFVSAVVPMHAHRQRMPACDTSAGCTCLQERDYSELLPKAFAAVNDQNSSPSEEEVLLATSIAVHHQVGNFRC